MADITISAVSASYSGTENADDFKNGTGNLRDITVKGLDGADILSFGSAVQAGTGDGGRGLGYSIGSSSLRMGAGDDTLTFSGQAGSGAAQLRSTNIKLGAGDDYSLINGLVSASGSTFRGNEGNDEIVFANASAGGSTASNVILNANAGDDSVNFTWTGTEANGLGVLGGGGADTISATFNVVSAYASASNTFSGAKVGGGKGADEMYVRVIGTSDQVRINGNSGNDTITVTAAADNVNFAVAGGKGDDLITAAFLAGNSSDAATVAGSLGDDTVNVKFSGGHVSGLSLNGASGDDALVFSNQGAALSAGMEILGGTGADTITMNVGGLINISAVSGFVADLGGAGTTAASGGGTEGVGGAFDINLSATMSAATGGAFFRGTNTGDDIDISNATGGGGLTNVTFSAEDGADTITFESHSAGGYNFTTIDAGGGADLITAQIGVGTNFNAATGGRLSFAGGGGNDTMVVNIEQGADISAGLFDGGAGADSITLNLLSGGTASIVNSGTELVGGSGADTIAIAALQATTAGVVIRGGSGADVITGTFASGGATDAAFTAFGGDGADTIAFTFSAAASAGITMAGANGAVFDGGAGADSISVLGLSVTGGTLDIGDVRGGAGNDTITIGGMVGSAGGYASTITGIVNGGAGTDSIIFSGNNVNSAGVSVFAGGGTNGTGGFVFASADSQVGGFDTIAVSNDAVTGGQTMLAGTFGSAGFLFSGFNAGGTFTMKVQTAGHLGTTFTGGGGFNFSDAIFTSDQTQGTTDGAVMTGGVIGGVTAQGAAGSAGGAVNGAFIVSGGSTLNEIFSAVDGMTIARGAVSLFNVQNGSGGSVDGYMFIQGGVFTDQVVKFEGHGLGAGTFSAGEGYFSAGLANGLVAGRTVAGLASGGQVFFGSNVGVG